MAHPNIELLGAVYPTVPAVKLPIYGGGTAQFDDTTDADATAADIASGKTAYVNGVKLTGTGGGGGGIIIDDTPDPAGGTIREITAITISGTYTATTNTSGVDISGYQYLDVAIPVPVLSPLTVTPTVTTTTYTGSYDEVTVEAIPLGSVAVTSSTATATPSISVSTAGVITASVSGSKSVGATVTTGYVSSASSGTVTITGSTTSSLTTTAGTHITPTTTAQTAVPAYRYTTGSVIVDAIPSEYIVPSGTYTATTNTSSVDIGAYKYLTVNVGGGKAAQIANGFNRVASSSYVAVSGQSITVGKTGTYDVYWVGYRSSTSGTNGSQLYIGNTAYGTANTSFDGTYTNWQMNHLSNVSLTANQTITVRARSRGTSYYMYIANLTIIES